VDGQERVHAHSVADGTELLVAREWEGRVNAIALEDFSGRLAVGGWFDEVAVFELAAGRPRKHLTLVHKTNVLTFAGSLWERTFNDVAAEFPDVATAYNHVDAACIYFVQDPHRYDVIVTDNLFGDILTDLGGAVSGGIGLASSANLNPSRTGPSMFEPVHGSAPDIVGQNKANPTAAILSAALMLDFLGEVAAAEGIRAACADPVTGSTTDVGDAIADRVRN